MTALRLLYVFLGTYSVISSGRLERRQDRGFSQSTENVILLVGAVAVAAAVVKVVTDFVAANLQLTAP